jgi:sodium-independent sulfate anion transporter 11
MSKMGFKHTIQVELASDQNIRRVHSLTRRGAHSFPAAASKYLVDKVPIAQWLPKYLPIWLLSDVIAGVTIGVLIPQALAYANIAIIPGEFGLMSSWLPPALYAIMGTSKGMMRPSLFLSLANGPE